jgi:hypothetical protein
MRSDSPRRRTPQYDEHGRKVGAQSDRVEETFSDKMEAWREAAGASSYSNKQRASLQKLFEEQQVLLEQQRALAQQYSALLQGGDGLIESARLSLRNLDAAIVSSKQPGYFRYFQPSARVAKIEGDHQLEKLKDQIRAVQKKIDRNALRHFYTRFAPHRLDTVDAVLQRFAGRESELFEKLYKKYDAGGDGPDAAAPEDGSGRSVSTLSQVRSPSRVLLALALARPARRTRPSNAPCRSLSLSRSLLLRRPAAPRHAPLLPPTPHVVVRHVRREAEDAGDPSVHAQQF